MTSESEAAPLAGPKRSWLPWAAAYGLLALVGLVGTWYFNLSFRPVDDMNYLQAWFANPASSSAAVDVIVAALAASIFFVSEGLRLGWRWAWVFIPLTFAVALAFAFPLFLALRERALGTRRDGAVAHREGAA